MQFFPIFCVLLCALLVTCVNAFALPRSFRVFAGRNGDVTASRAERSPVTFGSTIQKISKMRAGASKSVTEIANQVQFVQLLKDTGKNKLIVADFTASWCPPCKMIAPIYQSMSEEFPNVVFTKVCVKLILKNLLWCTNLVFSVSFDCCRLTWTLLLMWQKSTLYNRCPPFCSSRMVESLRGFLGQA